MNTPVLEVAGLTAGYDGAPVVRDLGITVGAGEVVALLGANGAGKTTTLKAVPPPAPSPSPEPPATRCRRRPARDGASPMSRKAGASSPG